MFDDDVGGADLAYVASVLIDLYIDVSQQSALGVGAGYRNQAAGSVGNAAVVSLVGMARYH